MNVLDCWPDQAKSNSLETWEEILGLRKKTFLGFLEVENHRGFLAPCSFNSSKGQEMIRILLFRTFEELAESALSNDEHHWKEEVVDAFNFLYGIPFLDEQSLSIEEIQHSLCQLCTDERIFKNMKIAPFDLGMLVVYMGESVGDFLRNRAWMHNAQDLYFSGIDGFLDYLKILTESMMGSFENFEEFYKYFVAKDSVLQFRLRSKY